MTASRSRPQCTVLLVDHSAELEELAAPLFESDVVTSAGHGCDFAGALEAVKAHDPDVILMDLAEGLTQGFQAIAAIMAERPKPILVLYPKTEAHADVFVALDLGALDLMERPRVPPRSYWQDLAKRLALLSQVRVVQHVKGKRRHRSTPVPSAPFPCVAIAASLGGPKALSTILKMLPVAFPAPILICQHITSGFTEGLSQWLASETALRVGEARHAEKLAPGHVYVAPSGAHLTVGPHLAVKLDDGPPIHGFKPSCDALLRSAAQQFRTRLVGVVLTGMGSDGARGLLEVRRQGGRTLVQDEATSIVFGMPKEAIALGAAEEVLPLEQIAPALIRWVAQC